MRSESNNREAKYYQGLVGHGKGRVVLLNVCMVQAGLLSRQDLLLCPSPQERCRTHPPKTAFSALSTLPGTAWLPSFQTSAAWEGPGRWHDCGESWQLAGMEQGGFQPRAREFQTIQHLQSFHLAHMAWQTGPAWLDSNKRKEKDISHPLGQT